MGNKKVAGTIMLSMEDGSKEFLVHTVNDSVEFIIAEFSDEKTGLANILDFLKNTVQVDINQINLLDLINAQVANQNLPLFVFEMNQGNKNIDIANDYQWRKPEFMRKVLGSYELKGVPLF